MTDGGRSPSSRGSMNLSFDDLFGLRNPARRLDSIRARARDLQREFLKKPPIRAMRSFDLVSFPFLSDIVFWRANFAKNHPLRSPGVLKPVAMVVDYRMILFEDASGKRLLLNPLASDPDKIGIYRFFGKRLLRHEAVERHLASVALEPDDIDWVAVDHLHLQDLGALQRLFPRAEILVQQSELDWARNLHPVDELFFCRGGADVDVAGLRGAREIGESLALLPTPGHTPGHQTLVVRIPEGVATFGENGVSVDNYYPEDSGIEGVPEFARDARQEVLPIANTFWSAQAQYDSMILEKNLASPYRTYTTAALSDTRRIPLGLGFTMPAPRIRRFTPRLRHGTFRASDRRQPSPA